jgi:hypothetical protein
MRVIHVPWKKVSRFNKLAKIKKGWDGTFCSPYGNGYCQQGENWEVIYLFDI